MAIGRYEVVDTKLARGNKGSYDFAAVIVLGASGKDLQGCGPEWISGHSSWSTDFAGRKHIAWRRIAAYLLIRKRSAGCRELQNERWDRRDISRAGRRIATYVSGFEKSATGSGAEMIILSLVAGASSVSNSNELEESGNTPTMAKLSARLPVPLPERPKRGSVEKESCEFGSRRECR